jgi:hypothetical protein
LPTASVHTSQFQLQINRFDLAYIQIGVDSNRPETFFFGIDLDTTYR